MPDGQLGVCGSVQAGADALLAAAHMHDVSTTASGIRTPPVTEGPPKEAKSQLLSAVQIVERMWVLYPALRAAKIDPDLTRLFLAELTTQAVNEEMEVILPEGIATRSVSRDNFQG